MCSVMTRWVGWGRERGEGLYIYTHIADSGFPVDTGDKEPACQCRKHKRSGFSP